MNSKLKIMYDSKNFKSRYKNSILNNPYSNCFMLLELFLTYKGKTNLR